MLKRPLAVHQNFNDIVKALQSGKQRFLELTVSSVETICESVGAIDHVEQSIREWT